MAEALSATMSALEPSGSVGFCQLELSLLRPTGRPVRKKATTIGAGARDKLGKEGVEALVVREKGA